MGAEPYSYFVPYQPDVSVALKELREREFAAGRFHPVITLRFHDGAGPNEAGQSQFATIDEAREAAGADGTRSILDLDHISGEPEFFGAAKLSDGELEDLFGTTMPTHDMVEDCDELWDTIDRGQGVCVIVYKDGQPDEIFFAGYSFD